MRMTRILAAGLVLTAATLASGQPSGSSALGPVAARSDRASVVCSGSEVQALLAGFARRFNRGNLVQLDEIFADETSFQWYSSNVPGARLGAAAYDRATLMDYFRRRHRQGDRFQFVTFRSGYDAQRQLRNFSFDARRQARDFRSDSWFTLEGKGAVDCSRRPLRVIVMSLGGPKR